MVNTRKVIKKIKKKERCCQFDTLKPQRERERKQFEVVQAEL